MSERVDDSNGGFDGSSEVLIAIPLIVSETEDNYISLIFPQFLKQKLEDDV